jgi:hypothetical protein
MTVEEIARRIYQPKGLYLPLGKYFKREEFTIYSLGVDNQVPRYFENTPHELMELVVKRRLECLGVR